ncbi:MAG: hypothetical protein H0W88_08190 [Parachlamydiaceae bacterium]|nr:hypothetical protein [Parachlamydiaceae bacterium]
MYNKLMFMISCVFALVFLNVVTTNVYAAKTTIENPGSTYYKTPSPLSPANPNNVNNSLPAPINPTSANAPVYTSPSTFSNDFYSPYSSNRAPISPGYSSPGSVSANYYYYNNPTSPYYGNPNSPYFHYANPTSPTNSSYSTPSSQNINPYKSSLPGSAIQHQ